MAVSDDLMRLSQRAKQAEDRVAAAKTQAHDRLEKNVEQARQDTQTMAEKLRSDTASATDRARSWGDDIQQSWNQHLASVREKVDATCLHRAPGDRRATGPVRRGCRQAHPAGGAGGPTGRRRVLQP